MPSHEQMKHFRHRSHNIYKCSGVSIATYLKCERVYAYRCLIFDYRSDKTNNNRYQKNTERKK